MTANPSRCTECGRCWDPTTFVSLATPAVAMEAELADGSVIPVVALALDGDGNVRALVVEADGLILEPASAAIVRVAPSTTAANDHPRPGRRFT